LSKVSLNIIALSALLTFSALANEQKSQAELSFILMEAEDYLSVKPSKSLALLSPQVNLTQLAAPQFFRWHTALIRSALKLNKLAIMEHSINELIKHRLSSEFNQRLVTILSSIGIWLRKSGYFEQSKLTLICALTHNKNDEKKITLLTSIAITYRHQSQNDDAVKLYILAKSIAQKKQNLLSLARIENNLGVIEIENDAPEKAEAHFRKALTIYQSKSNRSGNVNSGINLLMAFLIQDQLTNYLRLSPSITRLTEDFPNTTRKNSLYWLNTVFQMRQGLELDEQIRSQLIESFDNINNRKVQFYLKKYFAHELKVNVAVPSQISQQQSPPLWFNEINQCDWEELKTQKPEISG
jgi:tetratricopeptide (TPR) repeat protein